MTATSLDTIPGVDLDATVSCGCCDQAAEWRLQTRCCGKATLLCDRCRNLARSAFAAVALTAALPGNGMRCRDCHEPVTSWADFYREVRL